MYMYICTCLLYYMYMCNTDLCVCGREHGDTLTPHAGGERDHCVTDSSLTAQTGEGGEDIGEWSQ